MVSAHCEPRSASGTAAITRHVDRVFNPGAKHELTRGDWVMRLSQRHTNILEATDWRDAQMHAQRTDRRGDLRPAMVAAIVAIGATARILFNDFSPSNASQDGGAARMITAAALSRAARSRFRPSRRSGSSLSALNRLFHSRQGVQHK
jgi:hypothetical protein